MSTKHPNLKIWRFFENFHSVVGLSTRIPEVDEAFVWRVGKLFLNIQHQNLSIYDWPSLTSITHSEVTTG